MRIIYSVIKRIQSVKHDGVSSLLLWSFFTPTLTSTGVGGAQNPEEIQNLQLLCIALFEFSGWKFISSRLYAIMEYHRKR